MEARLPRKLAAILYADVAGYSRLTGEDEEGTHRRLSDGLDLISAAVESHNGRVVHYAGDAILADFGTASDALSCAVSIQRRLEAGGESAPEAVGIRFRIGVNLGEVIVDRNDIYGDGVNVAARLESLADPGGICISGTVYDAIGHTAALGFEFMGEQTVKNIAQPVRAFKVLLDSKPQAGARRPTGAPLPDKPSIAVLPFSNLSGDPEQEYFSDGLTEDIITSLSRFHSLMVIARNSTFVHKGQAVNVRTVGKDLGARYVIEGSVRKAGNRVRVTAQLIDAHTEKHLWAQSFDRDLDDIFAVQDELTAAIVGSLPERVSAADLERVKRKPTEQMVAYDYFLQGRELHHVGTKEACIEGIERLEKAVELDPNFAQAWAWLSCIVGQAWVRGYLPDPGRLWTRCVTYAQKALELDEEDSECHRILSEIYLIQRKFDEAEYHNERGLSLNPSDTRLTVQRGYLLAYVGRAEEGIEWVNKALSLDPYKPENYYANLGIVLHAAGCYAKAAEVFKRVPRLQAGHHAYAASCHVRLGESDLAAEHRAAALELDPGFTVSSYSRTLRYKDRSDLDHLLNGLREAGFPE